MTKVRKCPVCLAIRSSRSSFVRLRVPEGPFVGSSQNAERFALSPRRAAWYPKPAPTFADALAKLRWHLWLERTVMSAETTDVTESIAPEFQGILDAVCYAP